jgi:hypothetical protein
MMQFYFLSILFNAAAGYLLASEHNSEATFAETGVPRFLQNETLRLILGILTALTGILKFLSATKGDIPVVGDFVPALLGIVAGFTLVVEFYRSHSTLDSDVSSVDHPEKVTQFLVKNRRIVGFAAIASAALHFLFPGVLLL